MNSLVFPKFFIYCLEHFRTISTITLIDYISASCCTVFNTSICNIHSLKMQPFSSKYNQVTQLTMIKNNDNDSNITLRAAP
jgi:hypothetical protein